MNATKETNHAQENAQGHAEIIEAYAEAVAWLREYREAPEEASELSREARAAMHKHGWDGTNRDNTAEAIEEDAREQALSVEFRCSQWSASASEIEADEYRIVLSTGGPALQITGEFDTHRGATSWRMEYQDWGTPWTEHYGTDEDALRWFADLFCLGEC